MRGKLTAVTIGQCKVDADKTRKKLYDGTHGLFLEVFSTGAKCWQQRLQISGKRRTGGLGGYPSVSLAQARVRACENWLLAQSGGDPFPKERSKVKAIPTFEEAAAAVIERDAPTWRDPKHPQDWRNTLARYAFPTLGRLPVPQIEMQSVIEALVPIWSTRPETARRVLQRIRAVFDWAIAHGYRTDNPAAAAIHGALTKRRPQQRQKRHHPAIPYAQLPELSVAVRRMRAALPVRLLFEFVALTVVRSGEARGARWGEFDFDTGVWFIPGSRMKVGFPHRVPLSDRVLEILSELRRSDTHSDTDLVFPGARPGRPPSGDALMGLLRRLSAPYTVHGLRSTFTDRVFACLCDVGGVLRRHLHHHGLTLRVAVGGEPCPGRPTAAVEADGGALAHRAVEVDPVPVEYGRAPFVVRAPPLRVLRVPLRVALYPPRRIGVPR